jgi:hypothetical protein
MSFVELLVSPKTLLEVFEAKNVSTGMTLAAPGGATLTVGGLEKHTYGTLPLVPVILTVESGVAINLLSSWLCDKLNHAGVRHVRIEGVEIEATPKGITKAISESITIERKLKGTDDQAQETPLVQPPVMSPEERKNKLRQLEICRQSGEQAYDDLYEKVRRPGDATAYYSDAKESFYAAIGLARELGLEQEVEKLEKRLLHIKAVFRSQFS